MSCDWHLYCWWTKIHGKGFIEISKYLLWGVSPDYKDALYLQKEGYKLFEVLRLKIMTSV